VADGDDDDVQVDGDDVQAEGDDVQVDGDDVQAEGDDVQGDGDDVQGDGDDDVRVEEAGNAEPEGAPASDGGGGGGTGVVQPVQCSRIRHEVQVRGLVFERDR
jgi:hypothetical protein